MNFTKTNPKFELSIVKAKGSLLFDDGGKKYIDFVCGRGTANIGHCHPIVVRAIQRQASKMIHFSNEIRMPVQEEYTHRLGEIIPEFNTVYLANSGAEAVEAAIKLSRLHTGRTEILSFSQGFHGRSMGALSATSGDKIRLPFFPLVPGFTICEPNLESVLENISEATAAIIIEPIQGAGGVVIFPEKFLQSLREVTAQKGIMLIFDECQCGFGRTGDYFAFQKFKVTPDILVASKSICGGIPAGAIFTKSIDFPEDLHGGTFCGNPLACAAGIGVLDAFKNENILEKVAERVEMTTQIGRAIISKPYVKDFRYCGLMIGLEFNADLINSNALIAYCVSKGLLINIVKKNIIRILPALNIPKAYLQKGFEIIDEGLKELAG